MHELNVLIAATAALSMAHLAGAAELNKKDSNDPDVKKFAAASYKTVSMHKKVVDGLHANLGKNK